MTAESAQTRGVSLPRVNVLETESAALLSLSAGDFVIWLPSTHRPQRPAAHLPLKGRGTDFQVVAVKTQDNRKTIICHHRELILLPCNHSDRYV